MVAGNIPLFPRTRLPTNARREEKRKYSCTLSVRSVSLLFEQSYKQYFRP